jgi:hypothetical protein
MERLETMEHDKAVAALESLPEIGRVAVVRLRPTDVIVAELDGLCTDSTRARLEATLRPIWPEHKILVYDRGLRLKVVDGA